MTNDDYVRLTRFPDYMIFPDGRIFSDNHINPLAVNYNQYGTPYVRLRSWPDNELRVVPVARLVAQAYLIPPPRATGEVSDTIIHKDFNKNNFDYTNLAWRPRWFALEYHVLPMEPGVLNPHCEKSDSFLKDRPLIEVHSGMYSSDGYVEFSKHYGLLPMQIAFDTIYNPSRSETISPNRRTKFGFQLMGIMGVRFEET